MSMSDPNSDLHFTASATADNTQAVKISTEVMVAAVIFLFFVVLFIFVLYLYARRFLSPSAALDRRTSRRHLIFSPAATANRRGLDTALLASLPAEIYHSPDVEKGEEPLECAVCLSEVADGEKVRLLPKCGHGFHLECIDMWFHSNCTCPLCRAPVENAVEETVAVSEGEDTALPTNVLFWGNQDSVSSRDVPVAGELAPSSSRGAGGLVIEIPSRRGVEAIVSPASPLPLSMASGEEMRSPLSARFRNLRKLWNRGTGASCTCSPRDCDVELGFGGFAAGESSSKTPKTPRTPKVLNSYTESGSRTPRTPKTVLNS